MIKGIIFDFNGTLYKDNDLNHTAWSQLFDLIVNKEDVGKYSEYEHAHKNEINDYQRCSGILSYSNKDNSDKAYINYLGDIKEKLYQSLAREYKRDKFTDGFIELMDYLVAHKIPYTIASMAPKSNIDFYLSYLKLDRWFTYDDIIYDNGNYDNKNDMYLDACKIMNVDIKDILLFEDTPTVINKALEIGVNNIIYINNRNQELNLKQIKQELVDFKELDYSIIEML